MSQSYCKVYVHIVFSTKYRVPLIDLGIANRLYGYIAGIAKGLDCKPIEIGGHRDHVHILCLMRRKIYIAHLVSRIKSNSSKWIKTIDAKYANFFWQRGYAIFSVYPDEIEVVRRYIERQEEHHSQMTFKKEYLSLLEKYEVDFDEKYVWD